VVQLGGDLAQWSGNGLERYHLGAMVGYGNQHSNTNNNFTGFSSKGKVDGYSVGLYGTWYQNDVNKEGAYIDSWVIYNWFDNEVKGQEINSESYKSRGVVASIESGYSFKINEYHTRTGMLNSVWLQPQAQVTWIGVSADDHTEYNGTHVKSTGNDNIQTRLGMRAYLQGHSVQDEGKNRDFEPFVEANWIYNRKQYGVSMNDEKYSGMGARNVGELKLGVEAKVDNNLHLWGNVAQQMGGAGYNDTQGVFGVKYAF
jgi:autotransporter family porin